MIKLLCWTLYLSGILAWIHILGRLDPFGLEEDNKSHSDDGGRALLTALSTLLWPISFPVLGFVLMAIRAYKAGAAKRKQ